MSDPEQTPTDPAPAMPPSMEDVMHVLSGLVERFDGFERTLERLEARTEGCEKASEQLRQAVIVVADDQSRLRSELQSFMRDMRDEIAEARGERARLRRRVSEIEGGGGDASPNGASQ